MKLRNAFGPATARDYRLAHGILSACIGHPCGILDAANDPRGDVPERLEALAHCATCGVFLRSDESCLHMPPQTAVPSGSAVSCRAGSAARPVPVVGLPHNTSEVSDV